MIWVLAAMPLWVCGFLFLYAAFACVAVRRPGETNVDLLRQFGLNIGISMLLLYLAARMSS